MFEKYTEKARRVIFFARYEASQLGQPYIETEHILLGLLREDKAHTSRFLGEDSAESIRTQIEGHTTIRQKVSTSVDLPLSNESKRVLAYAAEQAEKLGHRYVGTEHLLLGLLREEHSFAAEILRERGIRLDQVRTELAGAGPMTASRQLGPPELQFVDANGSRLSASVRGREILVPRKGDQLILETLERRAAYSVQQVTYEYQKFTENETNAVNHLEKIVVVLVREEPDDKGSR